MRRMMVMLLAGLFSMTAICNSAMAAKAAKGQRGEGRGVERIKDELTKLNLSDEQTKKISAILDDAQAKLQAAMSEAKSSGDKAAARGKIKPIVTDVMQKISAELTPEQKTKFREAMQEMRQQRQEKKAGATTQPTA